MPISYNAAFNAAYERLCQRIDDALREWIPGMLIDVDVSDVDFGVRSGVIALYTELGWTVESDYCPGEYDDLVFSGGK